MRRAQKFVALGILATALLVPVNSAALAEQGKYLGPPVPAPSTLDHPGNSQTAWGWLWHWLDWLHPGPLGH